MEDLLNSLLNEEYGDVRSYMDEHFFPAKPDEVAGMIVLLHKLSPVVWTYSDIDGWGYEE